MDISFWFTALGFLGALVVLYSIIMILEKESEKHLCLMGLGMLAILLACLGLGLLTRLVITLFSLTMGVAVGFALYFMMQAIESLIPETGKKG